MTDDAKVGAMADLLGGLFGRNALRLYDEHSSEDGNRAGHLPTSATANEWQPIQTWQPLVNAEEGGWRTEDLAGQALELFDAAERFSAGAGQR